MSDRIRVDRFLPLTPKIFHILLSLADGPRHGYGVMLEVRERTAGKVRLWPTGLYGALRELEDRNFIVESKERPVAETDDQRRRYFELTTLGRKVLTAEVERLRELLDHAAAVGTSRKPRRA